MSVRNCVVGHLPIALHQNLECYVLTDEALSAFHLPAHNKKSTIFQSSHTLIFIYVLCFLAVILYNIENDTELSNSTCSQDYLISCAVIISSTCKCYMMKTTSSYYRFENTEKRQILESVLDRGSRSDWLRIDPNIDLDLWPSVSIPCLRTMVVTHTCKRLQSLKGQSVWKIEWKQTDRWAEAIALPPVLTRW